MRDTTRKLEVVDVFSSLQGEGKFAGANATFLRLRRCNLACLWCDERRTWDKQDLEYQNYSLYTQDELVDMLQGMPAPHLVITGGEPMLWQEQLSSVIPKLSVFDYVEIETAGTILPKLGDDSILHFNVSPKLLSSGNTGRVRLRWDALEEYAKLACGDQAIFKFVACSLADFREIQDIVDRLNLPSSNVYVMAEGITADKQLAGMRELVGPILDRGWNLSPRLHILLWGNQHGR